MCRGIAKVTPDLLKEWGRKASEQTAQVAFLMYLLRGSQSGQISISAEERDKSWLGTILDNNGLRKEFNDSEWLQIMGKLGYTSSTPQRVDPPVLPVAQTLSPAQKSQCIMRIAEWWERNKETELPNFEQKLYQIGRAHV